MDGLLKEKNLIMGGDLKFIISNMEVWGSHPLKDPLEGFFYHLLETNHIIDLEPYYPPSLGVTKKMMYQGPWVADTECQESYS